jgi:Ca2+-transporting ATPase
MGGVLAMRSESDSLFRIGIFSNWKLLAAVALTVLLQICVVYIPFLQVTFSTEALTLRELGIAFGSGVIIFLILESEKWIRNRELR